MDFSRRDIALSLSLSLGLSAFSARHDIIKNDLILIEKEFNGRLGVALIGENGFQFLYRAMNCLTIVPFLNGF